MNFSFDIVLYHHLHCSLSTVPSSQFPCKSKYSFESVWQYIASVVIWCLTLKSNLNVIFYLISEFLFKIFFFFCIWYLMSLSIGIHSDSASVTLKTAFLLSFPIQIDTHLWIFYHFDYYYPATKIEWQHSVIKYKWIRSKNSFCPHCSNTFQIQSNRITFMMIHMPLPIHIVISILVFCVSFDENVYDLVATFPEIDSMS